MEPVGATLLGEKEFKQRGLVQLLFGPGFTLVLFAQEEICQLKEVMLGSGL